MTGTESKSKRIAAPARTRSCRLDEDVGGWLVRERGPHVFAWQPPAWRHWHPARSLPTHSKVGGSTNGLSRSRVRALRLQQPLPLPNKRADHSETLPIRPSSGCHIPPRGAHPGNRMQKRSDPSGINQAKMSGWVELTRTGSLEPAVDRASN